MTPNFNKEMIVPTFELLPIFNQVKSKKEGRSIFDDKEVCRIRIAGNRSTVGVFPAHEVFTRKADPMSGMVTEVTYAMEYNDAYLQFKHGSAQSISGTPLSELPFLTPGKRLELKALAVHTAEALAGLDGANLKALGMGGRELKAQAIAFLEVAAGTQNNLQIKELLEARDRDIAELREQVALLLKGEQPKAPDTSNPFSDFGDEDVVNWIKDADKTVHIDGRWGRSKLLEVAAEINERLKKAA